jgi:hypothetical protein
MDSLELCRSGRALIRGCIGAIGAALAKPVGRCPFLALFVQQWPANGGKARHKAKPRKRRILRRWRMVWQGPANRCRPGLLATVGSQPWQLRALAGYRFDAKRIAAVNVPTLLLTGSETRRRI